MSNLIYDEKFYNIQSKPSKQSAYAVVPILIDLLHPKSVVDIGCGVGTWLGAFLKNNITDILGIDGEYVNRKKLHIPESCFRSMDLTHPSPIDKKFDLSICLEVAEHLSKTSADELIDFITSLAPVVYFSAAIPGQGGDDHVNEQWPDYWCKLFADRGYQIADVIRPKIWNYSQVQPWYCQNSFLYIHKDSVNNYKDLFSIDSNLLSFPLRVIHPELFRRFVSLEYVHGKQ